MATAPNQGIMALPENQDMQTPQLSLTDSYDAMRQALQTARPDADMEMEEALQEIRPMIDELTDEQLSLLIEAIQALYNNPENYDKIVQELVRGQFIESAEELPPEYDEQFIATLLMLLVDNQRLRMKATSAPPQTPELSPPQNFARGGIAEAARMVAGYGRNGDTMLAHITPEEARLLKARGGSGTINPQTGLPEFWPLLSTKRGIGKAVVKVLNNPVGRVIATVALGAVLGPAVGAVMPGLSAAATAGITGALSSGIITAATGGDLKSILTSAAIGFFSAPGGPVSNYIGKYTASLGVTNPIVNQALSGAVVGTGAGLISGQGIKAALRSGLIEGAIAGGTALVSGAPKTDVDNAARTKASAATQAASAAEAVGATPLDVDVGTNAAIDDFLGKNKPDVMGAGAQRIADEAQVTGTSTRPASADTSIVRKTYSDGRITEQLIDKQGVPLLDESIIAPSTPKVSAAPTKFGMDAPFPGSDVRRADGIKGLTMGEGVGQAQLSGINPPTPPVSAAPTQFGTAAEFPGTTPRPAGANTQLAAAQTPLNVPVPSRASVLGPEGYTPTGELLPSLDYADNVQYMSYPGELPNTEIPGVTTAYVGKQSAAAPYTVPEYGESFAKMGRGAKQFLSGDLKEGGKQFLQGAEDLFFPGPSGAQKQAMLDEVMAKYPKYTPDQAMDYLKESNRLPGFVRTYGPGTAAGIGALYAMGGFDTNPNLGTEEQQRFIKQMRGPIDLSGNPRGYYVQGLPGVQYGGRGEIIGSGQWAPASTLADVTTEYGYNYAPDYGFSPGQYNYQNAFSFPRYANMGGLMETKGHSSQPSYEFMGSPQYMNVGGIAALTQGGYPRKTGQISGPGTEKSDSIPAMLSDGEFVMTAKAVRGAGGGSRREGAKRMYALMHQLERNAARG